jgi:GH15 family glucan-1,4-alpha-glucosidase
MIRNMNFGVIGNCRSNALVSEDGSIDWCCFPDPDSPSVFARIIDEKKGGHFSILTDGKYSVTQKYDGDTNVLLTSFANENNAFDVIDFMPRYKTEEGQYYHSPEIYRILRLVRGKPVIQVDYQPKLNYAIAETRHEIQQDFIKSMTVSGRYESVYLYSGIGFTHIIEKHWVELTSDSFFLICYNQKLIKVDLRRAYLEYYRTLVYWLNWSNRNRRYSKYQKEILRSALVLKLLTYQKTGAIIAAATTSIPETLGQRRNWDYRYCWIRDSSMIIKVLTDTGHLVSAKRFLNFILTVNQGKHEDVQIMYGIRGERRLEEKILRHLSGYKDSKPVRIGNSAYIQKQNDIYGILIDAIYISLTRFPSTLDITEELWTFVRGMIEMVAASWFNPDRGIWEIRGESRHFVFSKMLSWVALDRGCKIAVMVKKSSYLKAWNELKQTIRDDIFRNGWDPEIKSFTQAYGSKDLDASLLLMEDYGFIAASDPMYKSTVLNIRDQLCKNGMMFRYLNRDDFGIPHNSLVICTFWLINSLYKIGYTEEAVALFENLIKCSNHLGLFSEHIDIDTRELLGNFPQGYSHIGLIQSAMILNGIIPEPPVEKLNFIKP